jgi:hypothetical protein
MQPQDVYVVNKNGNLTVCDKPEWSPNEYQQLFRVEPLGERYVLTREELEAFADAIDNAALLRGIDRAHGKKTDEPDFKTLFNNLVNGK